MFSSHPSVTFVSGVIACKAVLQGCQNKCLRKRRDVLIGGRTARLERNLVQAGKAYSVGLQPSSPGPPPPLLPHPAHLLIKDMNLNDETAHKTTITPTDLLPLSYNPLLPLSYNPHRSPTCPLVKLLRREVCSHAAATSTQ